MDNLVYVATKKVGSHALVGYFLAADKIPAGWTPSSEKTRDITDVMRSLRCSKEEAVKVMNSHWS